MTSDKLVVAPTAVAVAVDFGRVAQTLNYYANRLTSAIAFRYGSCTFPPIGSRAISESISLLNALPPNLGFSVKEMDDRNFVVSFSEYVFSIGFNDEFERLRDNVIKEVAHSRSMETIVGRSDVPYDHMLIGVIARTRLLSDIAHPEAVTSIGTTPA